MRKVRIGSRVISRDVFDMPYFIAEAGVNHEGDIEKAKLMIDQAAEAGADAIKFQTYKAHKLASRYSPAYWDQNAEPTPTQYELFKKYDAFGEREYRILQSYALSRGIDFLSTPFDFESVDLLEPLVPAYKIASADITNYPLLEYVAKKQKPIILSTGASSVWEIFKAVDVIVKAGNREIILLHCILNYPPPLERANLGMIKHMVELFPDFIVGYSDHTLPEYATEVLTSAWLLGAQVIEKHFTYDKTLPGNDHYHSLDADDLASVIRFFKTIKIAIGSFRKDYLPEENISRMNARRSLVAKRFIKSGERIHEEDIAIKRPGTGIPPEFINLVIGGVALKDIHEDEILQFGAIRLADRETW